MDTNPYPSRTLRYDHHRGERGPAVMRSIAVVLAVILHWVPECLAQPTTVHVDWDAARTIHENGEFRKGVRIWLASGKRRQGSLAGMDQSGLSLRRKGVDTRIPRDEIHAIRFLPLKPRTKKHRILAVLGGIPAGILTGLGVVALCCDVDRNSSLAAFHLTWAGVQVLLYRLGSKADRGTLHIVIQDPG